MPAVALISRPSAGLVPAAYLGLLYLLHDRADEIGHVRPRPGADVIQALAHAGARLLESALEDPESERPPYGLAASSGEAGLLPGAQTCARPGRLCGPPSAARGSPAPA
jgi:hypothetical protein